ARTAGAPGDGFLERTRSRPGDYSGRPARTALQSAGGRHLDRPVDRIADRAGVIPLELENPVQKLGPLPAPPAVRAVPGYRRRNRARAARRQRRRSRNLAAKTRADDERHHAGLRRSKAGLRPNGVMEYGSDGVLDLTILHPSIPPLNSWLWLRENRAVMFVTPQNGANVPACGRKIDPLDERRAVRRRRALVPL